MNYINFVLIAWSIEEGSSVQNEQGSCYLSAITCLCAFLGS